MEVYRVELMGRRSPARLVKYEARSWGWNYEIIRELAAAPMEVVSGNAIDHLLSTGVADSAPVAIELLYRGLENDGRFYEVGDLPVFFYRATDPRRPIEEQWAEEKAVHAAISLLKEDFEKYVASESSSSE